jgi:polar amino acid transport system ATP-binding protein
MPIIRMEAVNKWYGEFQVLTGIDLSVRQGERIVICGPSGSGKSTLIRCINRLETVQKGRIVVDGIDLTAGGKNVDAVRAEVGMVFQQFNLFPHLTILENCTLAPMRSRGMTKARPRRRHEVPHARAHSRAGQASTRASSPAASSSAWPLRARCA